MFQYLDKFKGPEKDQTDPGEYVLEPVQLAAFEDVPAISAYIDTLPDGLIADEI